MHDVSERSLPMRLVWVASGRGMLLRAATNAIDAKILNAHLSGIIVDRSCPTEDFARERGVRLFQVPPPGSDRSRFNNSMAYALEHSGADWAGMSFSQIIGPEPIDRLDGRIFNLHFSILPLFPGFNPIVKALNSRMRVAGVTIHLVDETLDGGAILGQTVCGISPTDTEATLGRRLFDAAVPLVIQTIRDISNRNLMLDADRMPQWGSDSTKNLAFNRIPMFDNDIVEFAKHFCSKI